jgi:chromosome segregation ATPase
VTQSKVVDVNALDHKGVVAISQQCTEDLEAKTREKTALAKTLAALKKSKLQYETKLAKKKKEVDTHVVQMIEMDKKLQLITNQNRMMTSELTGLCSENDKLRQDVEQLQRDFREASSSFEHEKEAVEKLRKKLFEYRKEITTEGRKRDELASDLRAHKLMQSLTISRLDDMEKKHRAMKTCLKGAINGADAR